MTSNELVEKLNKMYENRKYKKDKEQAMAIILFGIVYAEEIKKIKSDYSIDRIAEAATGKINYGTEIRAGMKLSKYVKLKPGVAVIPKIS